MAKKANSKAYPKDTNQLAKFIVDLAIGEDTDKPVSPDTKPISKKKNVNKR